MSWKPEVSTDEERTWAGNACRFGTEKEAQDYVRDLAARWWSVTNTRVTEVDEPVTSTWIEGKLAFLDGVV